MAGVYCILYTFLLSKDDLMKLNTYSNAYNYKMPVAMSMQLYCLLLDLSEFTLLIWEAFVSNLIYLYFDGINKRVDTSG